MAVLIGSITFLGLDLTQPPTRSGTSSVLGDVARAQIGTVLVAVAALLVIESSQIVGETLYEFPKRVRVIAEAFLPPLVFLISLGPFQSTLGMEPTLARVWADWLPPESAGYTHDQIIQFWVNDIPPSAFEWTVLCVGAIAAARTAVRTRASGRSGSSNDADADAAGAREAAH